jgi:hypothetical protein
VLYQASVRLLVDPRLITSWGHFRLRKEKEVSGVSFAVHVVGPKDRPVVRAVSTLDHGHPESYYQDGDPFHLAVRPYGFDEIKVSREIRAVSDVETDAYTSREPDRVLLLAQAAFQDVKRPRYRLPVREPDTRELAPHGAWQTWSWAVDERPLEARDGWRAGYWPAVRAYWLGTPLRPFERSTVFGFTSDYPPVRDFARVAGLPFANGVKFAAFNGGGIAAAAADLAGVSAAASGGINTPIALPAAAEGAAAAGLAPLGGLGGPFGGLGGAPLGGAGGGFPGGVGGGTTPGVGSGGGVPSGAGTTGGGGTSGSGPGNSNPNTTGTPTNPTNAVTGPSTNTGTTTGTGTTQNQNQTVTPQVPVTINLTPGAVTATNGGATNNNGGSTSTTTTTTSQVQSQTQSQSSTLSGNVVPAPPAWLLGVLGLPAFLLLARRRKQT